MTLTFHQRLVRQRSELMQQMYEYMKRGQRMNSQFKRDMW